MSEWRTIPDAPDYEVSPTGLVRREPLRRARGTRPGRPRTTSIGKVGYPVVNVRCADGKRRTLYVHRCVARAFFGDPPDGFEVNHKNGDKTDNRVENLEWTTRLGNVQHAIRTGLFDPHNQVNHSRGESHHSSKLTDADVLDIRAARARGETYQVLQDRYGVSSTAIAGAVKSRTWTHLPPCAAPNRQLIAMVRTSCAQCASEVVRKPSAIARRERTFCSRQCAADSKRRGTRHHGHLRVSRNGRRTVEHRYVMEQALGRRLLPSEVVRHIDGNPLNDAIDNLVVVSRSEHTALIHKARAKSRERVA